MCDGQVNDCTYIENGLNTLESDTDEDGFVECEWDPETWQGSNYIRGGNDCDDENSAVHPESDEICDEIDNNCDQIIDEDAIDQNTYFTDADGDGFGDLTDEGNIQGCSPPSGYVDNRTDCDDSTESISPTAEEICDEVDNNCDGFVDNDAIDVEVFYRDNDGDGYGTTTETQNAAGLRLIL